MSLQKNFLVGLVSIILGASFTLTGCGTASNNDQGTSFLAFGYFVFEDEDSTDVVPISFLRQDLFSDFGSSFGNTTPMIGLENRLETQFLRVERIDCSYFVDGASPGFSIPDDSTISGTVLGAQPNNDLRAGQTAFGDRNSNVDGDGNLNNDSENVRPQVIFTRVNIVDSDLRRFLNLNQKSLPTPPFTMTARCRGIGVTQAGDVLSTNLISIPIEFTNTLGSTEQVEGPTDLVTSTGNLEFETSELETATPELATAEASSSSDFGQSVAVSLSSSSDAASDNESEESSDESDSDESES